MAQVSINGQVRATRIDPMTNQPSGGMDVTFQDLATGVVDTIFVPDRIYNEDNVKALIASRIAQTSAVHSITEV